MVGGEVSAGVQRAEGEAVYDRRPDGPYVGTARGGSGGERNAGKSGGDGGAGQQGGAAV